MFSLLLVWNEISMGIFLYSLAFPGFLDHFNGTFLGAFENMFGVSLNYYLFIVPMLLEMLSVTYFIKHSRFVKVVKIGFHERSECC